MNFKMRNVFVERDARWGLDIDEVSGRMFVNIPVSNRMADYLEWYEVDQETFERFKANPNGQETLEFIRKAKARELDHLLAVLEARQRPRLGVGLPAPLERENDGRNVEASQETMTPR